MNKNITRSNLSVNVNVKKCEVSLHIFENWCTSWSEDGQSIYRHFYTLTFYSHNAFHTCTFVKELTHSPTTWHNKNAIIFADQLAQFALHNDTLAQSQTYSHTCMVLCTITFKVYKHAWTIIHTLLLAFTFHMWTLKNTLICCIHKHKQMHLIITFLFSIGSVIILFVFASVEEFMVNDESKHKCRCRFEDKAGICGMVPYIHHTCYNSGSIYQFHVMEIPTHICLHEGHEHHKKRTYIFEQSYCSRSSKSHQA